VSMQGQREAPIGKHEVDWEAPNIALLMVEQ
jgi:hypothetical protein